MICKFLVRLSQKPKHKLTNCLPYENMKLFTSMFKNNSQRKQNIDTCLYKLFSDYMTYCLPAEFLFKYCISSHEREESWVDQSSAVVRPNT